MALVPTGTPGQAQLVPGVSAGANPNAVTGLVVNLFLPGAGSMIAGKTNEGIGQLVLFVVGIPLSFILIGIPIVITAWAWALATGLRAVGDSAR